MKFLKEHNWIRTALVAVFFVIGMVLTIFGWKMTGELLGLGIMIVGIILMLTGLFVYNSQYKIRNKK